MAESNPSRLGKAERNLTGILATVIALYGIITADIADEWDARSQTYQLIATILAVGLSFAAWASLVDSGGVMRLAFTLVSTVVLLGCAVFLVVKLSTSEPLPSALQIDEATSTVEPTE